jgi:hypothetical protein
MKHSSIACLGLFTLLITGASRAELQIATDQYTARFSESDGRFTVVSQPSGKVFLSDGQFADGGGTAKVTDVTDKIFGQGKSIEITHSNGNTQSISLFPQVPFVLFRETRCNRGNEPIVLNHVTTVSAQVDLGVPAAALRSLGTGGLLAPEKNPGSYAFLALVEPQQRNGVVAGWLTHDRGSGVVFSPVKQNAVRLQSQIDYGRLRIMPGREAACETLAIGYFDDARLGLESYANAIAKVYSVHLHPRQTGYCTWYMEQHGGACDQQHLAELSQYAAKNLKPFGFDFIQIDDGWQEGTDNNGPRKNFTTHRPGGPYPNGMKAMAGEIDHLGLTPGIWFMPFVGNFKDPFFKDHQDWFAKGPDGKPFETDWGGTCLDLTNEGAKAHVRDTVRRIAHDWGYRLFKLDGFWTGTATRQIYVNDGYRDDSIGETEFTDPDKTNIEALRDGAKLVREAAGPDVFLLGCCVSQNMRSLGGSFGLLDAMRVGPDTGAGHIGAPHASRLWFLNGRVWWNDPDCVSVRSATPLEQARLNASFTTIAGDLFYNSDWMPALPPERLDILRRCMPSHDAVSRPVDVFEQQPARIWHVSDTRGSTRRDVVALYNWNEQPATIECDADRIGLPAADEYVAFDFWANQLLPPFRGKLRADLPAGGSCRILAVRPKCEHPQLLSTSRHITQGIVDVTEETWDAATATLSAASKIVADDPYELRIVLPAGDKPWRARSLNLSTESKGVQIKAELKQDGQLLRTTIRCPASVEVKWKVQFEPAKTNAPASR